MWISTEDALMLVRATADRVRDARDVLDDAEARRDALIVSFLGQGDMPTKDLAAAAGLTTGRLYQIATRDAAVADTDGVFARLREDPELTEAVDALNGSARITTDRRLRVS